MDIKKINEEFLTCNGKRAKDLITMGANPHYENEYGFNSFFYPESLEYEKFKILKDNNVNFSKDTFIDPVMVYNSIYKRRYHYLNKTILTPLNLFNPQFMRLIAGDDEKITNLFVMLLKHKEEVNQYYIDEMFESVVNELSVKSLDNIVKAMEGKQLSDDYLCFYIRNQRRIKHVIDDEDDFFEMLGEDELFIQND